MKTINTKMSLGAVVLFAVCSLATVRAVSPNGIYNISIPAEIIIVDPSGRYMESVSGVSMDFTLNCDAAGKITGVGTAYTRQMGVTINLNFSFTGAISGSGESPRLTLNMKGTGNASYMGQQFPVTFMATQKGAFDRQLEQIAGNVKVKVCVKEGGRNYCESGSETAYFDVPGSNIGDWNSTVNVTTDAKNRTTGSGVVQLSSGRQFNFNVTGKYTPKQDQAQLKLTAADRSSAKLSITAQPSGAMLLPVKMSGKLMGQAVKR